MLNISEFVQVIVGFVGCVYLTIIKDDGDVHVGRSCVWAKQELSYEAGSPIRVGCCRHE